VLRQADASSSRQNSNTHWLRWPADSRVRQWAGLMLPRICCQVRAGAACAGRSWPDGLSPPLKAIKAQAGAPSPT